MPWLPIASMCSAVVALVSLWQKVDAVPPTNDEQLDDVLSQPLPDFGNDADSQPKMTGNDRPCKFTIYHTEHFVYIT